MILCFLTGLGRKLVERLTSDKAIVYALDKSQPDLEKLKQDYNSVNILHADLQNWNETQKSC